MAQPLRQPVPFESSEDLIGAAIGCFAIQERLGARGMWFRLGMIPGA
jgi:hypothetical protein